jgi:hypothetical protein
MKTIHEPRDEGETCWCKGKVNKKCVQGDENLRYGWKTKNTQRYGHSSLSIKEKVVKTK